MHGSFVWQENGMHKQRGEIPRVVQSCPLAAHLGACLYGLLASLFEYKSCFEGNNEVSEFLTGIPIFRPLFRLVAYVTMWKDEI